MENTIIPFNIFSKLSEKNQKAYRIAAYDEILLNSISTMFTYKDIPKTIDVGFLEMFALIGGMAAVWKHDKFGWIASICGASGEPNAYGIGQDLNCTSFDGKSVTFNDWENNKDVIVLWNNSIKCPDMNIGRFADMFTEVETSMKLNVLFSRFYPIPVAKDNKVQKAINEAISNMLIGQIKDGCTVLDERFISDELDNPAGIDTVNLTDVQKSQNIQYLAKFRDDLFRWFYSLYGMNSQGSSKMAQQTVDEVNQDTNAAMIIPHDMLRCRQAFIEQAKEKQPEEFANADVSFSECWISRLANMDDEFKKTDEELEETTEGGTEDETEGSEPTEPTT